MTGTRLPFSLVPGGDTPHGRAWLVTFTDLICLMLTFFVMLYAMSEPNKDRLQALRQGLGGPAPARADGTAPPGAAFNVDALDREKAIDLGYLGRLLEQQLRRLPDLTGVTVTRRDDDLVLALPAELLFEPGSAELSQAGRRALFELGGTVANIGNALDAVGHTDPTPISRQFPSNWELSLARAAAVADALRESGYLRPITVRGQADGGFQEVAPWRSLLDRQRLARRVDLVVRDYRGGP